MKITMYRHDVMDAIELWMREKYDINKDLYDGVHEVYITYTEEIPVFKKHKNGKPILCERGFSERDWKATIRKKHTVDWGECDELSFYLLNDDER
jgi:hypothetical protein